MLKIKKLVVFSTILVICCLQTAMANEELARSNNCLACHSVDNKIIGPAFKDVAAKYKGDDSATATLVNKVKNGGGGVWGDIPMPPNAAASDADIETLVKWILSL